MNIIDTSKNLKNVPSMCIHCFHGFNDELLFSHVCMIQTEPYFKLNISKGKFLYKCRNYKQKR